MNLKCFYKFYIIIILINTLYCTTPTIISNKIYTETNVFLIDQKIQFTLPTTWLIYFSSNKYFQLVAKDPNYIYGPMLEYRGLTNTTKNLKERELYAEGWYKAIQLNFPKWEYLEKNYEDNNYKNNKIFSYTFLGIFYDGNVKIKKMGLLRFYNDRIHAIYFTAREEYFEENLDTFMEIDKKIIYEPTLHAY